MKRRVILDTGPLVASINRRDRFHEWAKTQPAEIEPPLLTCEAVLTEACHLPRDLPEGRQAVLEMVGRKIIAISLRVQCHVRSLKNLMQKYEDVPMSLADACLVRLSELNDASQLMTVATDFYVHRRHGRQVIAVLMPWTV